MKVGFDLKIVLLDMLSQLSRASKELIPNLFNWQINGFMKFSAPFEGTIARAKRGDFVYLDPPYIPIDITASFTSYHSEGFGVTDQQRLAKAMLELGQSGVKAMCSNSDTPLTREIYSQLNVATIQAPRMVSAKASGRGSVSELVITNY